MSLAAEFSAMASPRLRWTGKYPPGSPVEWLADGPVTCSIQCSGGNCDRHMVDVRLDTLPRHLPLATIGRRLVCKQCGVAGSVHIVPDWHDRALPFRLPGIGRVDALRKELTNVGLNLDFVAGVILSVGSGRLEGLVSKRNDRAYRAGVLPNWIESKNPERPAMTMHSDEAIPQKKVSR